MAQVFADAGYRMRKGMEDGVLAVEFPILPTDTSVGVMERREHRAERASMQRLLTPDRVALYGKGERVQGLVNSMLRGGYRGEIIAVGADGVEIGGVPTAETLAKVTGHLDLALVSVPTAELAEVVIDVAHKGAHGIVLMTGSDVGVGDNLKVINLARAYGVRALGPDALGLINTAAEVEMNATPGPMPRAGGVGLFCQSAAVGVALLNHAVRQDLGLSSFISTGDYADVTANDVMQYWEDDAADPGLPAVAGLDRQPAQVLPDHPAAHPAQAGGGLRPGPDQPLAARRRHAAGSGMPPTRRSTRCSGRPG